MQFKSISEHPLVPRKTSLFMLGGLLIAIAGAGWVATGNLTIGTPSRPGPAFLPRGLLAAMPVLALLLFAQAGLARAGTSPRWQPWQCLLVAIITGAVFYPFFLRALGALLIGFVADISRIMPLLNAPQNFLPLSIALALGPAEYLAIGVLHVVIAVALARYSRLAGLGMLAIGALLGLVGTDVETGVERMTYGFAALSDGFGFISIACGLILAAEGALALVSPVKWLAVVRHTFGFGSGRSVAPEIDTGLAIALRVAGAVLIVAAGAVAYRMSYDIADVLTVLAFGAFGIAAKACGWNRGFLLLGFLAAPLWEESLRRAMMLSRGNLPTMLDRPGVMVFLSVAALILLVLIIAMIYRFATRPKLSAG